MSLNKDTINLQNADRKHATNEPKSMLIGTLLMGNMWEGQFMVKYLNSKLSIATMKSIASISVNWQLASTFFMQPANKSLDSSTPYTVSGQLQKQCISIVICHAKAPLRKWFWAWRWVFSWIWFTYAWNRICQGDFDMYTVTFSTSPNSGKAWF